MVARLGSLERVAFRTQPVKIGPCFVNLGKGARQLELLVIAFAFLISARRRFMMFALHSLHDRQPRGVMRVFALVYL